MRMAIGTTFDYELPLEQQFALLDRTNFTTVSLGANETHSGFLNTLGRSRIQELAREHQIEIDSLHVPILQAYDLSKADTERRMAAVCRVALCLASAVDLGASTVVLHLNHFPPVSYEQQLKPLLRSLEALIESAENMKLNLAAENLYDSIGLEFLAGALEEFNSERFGFCYDSSHDQLSGQEPYTILERYADRLMALHLSDNDGKEDRHWVPFTGVVNWERICSILREHSYDRTLLLEVENSEKIDPEKFLLESSLAAERLQEMIGS